MFGFRRRVASRILHHRQIAQSAQSARWPLALAPTAALAAAMMVAPSTELRAQSPTAAAGDERLGLDPNAGLTLEQAMDAADAHSFAARIAERTVDEANARAGQSRGALGPRLAVEGDDSYIDHRVNRLAGKALPYGAPVPDRVETAAAVVTQPLIGLGGLVEKLSADARLADAARHDAELSHADARLAGADAYVRATKAIRLLNVARASMSATERQLSDAKALEGQGRLSPVDVMRIELAQSDVRTQLIEARTAVEVAALSLIDALGLPAGTAKVLLKAPAADAPVAPSRSQLPDLQTLTGAAASARADLKAAQNRVAAAQGYQVAGRFDFLPALNGFARYERDFTARPVDYGAESIAPGLHYDQRDVRDEFTVGVQLKWTIWDWNERLRRDDELAATAAKAQLAQDGLAARVYVDVASAYEELRSTLAALANARVSVRLAEEVYRATELKFQNGLATTTDLIAAERDQTRARGQVAIAGGDLDLAWLKLKRAAGDRVALLGF